MAAAAFAVLATVPAPPAGAQEDFGCAPPPSMAEVVTTAPVVFTGTVEEVRDGGREATVSIIRIWRGAPLPPKVQVRGTVATQSKVQTAHDRSYAQGATYLFVPTSGTRPHFVEDSCSPTALLDGTLAALQPRDGGSLPSGASQLSRSPTDPTKVLPLAIGAVAFVGLGSLLLRARRAGRRR